MRIKRAHTVSEYIDTPTSNDPSYRQSRQTKLADDFLDRHSFARQFEDRVGGFLSVLKAGPLPSFRTRKNCWIGIACGQYFLDRAHMLPDYVEEGGARILDQMPTVGNLDRLWSAFGRSFAVAGTAVACDNFDTRIISKPRGSRFALAVRKKRHNTASFEIADYGSVPTASTPCPIVDAHDAHRPDRPAGAATDAPQKRVLADGNGEPFSETVSRTAAECQTELIDDIFHARGPSRGRSRDAFIEPLGKYLSWTTLPRTSKTSDHDHDLDQPAVRRQISQ